MDAQDGALAVDVDLGVVERIAPGGALRDTEADGHAIGATGLLDGLDGLVCLIADDALLCVLGQGRDLGQGGVGLYEVLCMYIGREGVSHSHHRYIYTYKSEVITGDTYRVSRYERFWKDEQLDALLAGRLDDPGHLGGRRLFVHVNGGSMDSGGLEPESRDVVEGHGVQ